MCHLLLLGAAALSWSPSLTFSMSTEPTRAFPHCVIASGQCFPQVKCQITMLASHLSWGNKPCASTSITHMDGDIIVPHYGACSAQGKWEALASHGHLPPEGGRCRAGEGPGSTRASSGGVPIPGEPLTASPASPYLAEQLRS